MENQTNEKLPCGAVIVQATNGKANGVHPNRHAFEVKDGGFLTNAYQKFMIREYDVKSLLTIEERFEQAKQHVRQAAKSKGVSQIPQMQVYGDPAVKTERFQDMQRRLDWVLVIAPTYRTGEKYPPLAGARHDLCEFLEAFQGGWVFSDGARITVLAEGMGLMYARDNMEFLAPSQAEARAKLTEIMKFRGNVGVFVFAHGDRDTSTGRADEYVVFPERDGLDAAGRIYGLDVARLIVERIETKAGFLFSFWELCESHGCPGEDDMAQAAQEWAAGQGLVVARGAGGRAKAGRRTRHDRVKEIIAREADEVVNRFAYLAIAGFPIGAMTRAVSAKSRNTVEPYELLAVQEMHPGGDDFGMDGCTQNSLPEVDSLRIAPSFGDSPRAPFAPRFTQEQEQPVDVASFAPTDEIAQAILPMEGVPVGADEDEARARGLQEVAQGVQAAAQGLSSFWHELPGYISTAWGGLETAYGYLFGTGILSLVLPWLITAVMVAGGAALWLYLRFMVNNEARRLFPLLVVMVVTTLLPYLCDPAVLQKFFSLDNSVCVGLAFTAASFVVLLLSVAADWGKLSSRVGALFKATNLASKYGLLARLALEMHFMGGGRAIQQTVHVQVGGVSVFVMYYPLVANGTNGFCPVLLSGDDFMLLPSEYGFTVLNKELKNGDKADLTCMEDVFREQVRKRAEGDFGNVQGVSFNYGEHVIDTKALHLDTEYMRNLYRVDTAHWKDHPVLSKVALAADLPQHWTAAHERFQPQLPTLMKKSDLTTLEWVASPFFFVVEKLVGVSLWGLQQAGAPLSREL